MLMNGDFAVTDAVQLTVSVMLCWLIGVWYNVFTCSSVFDQIYVVLSEREFGRRLEILQLQLQFRQPLATISYFPHRGGVKP